MIKKVIIPVAWMWTRFLPATKASPKEMLPIVDKPVIQYIVEEAVNSWIEEIIFITGREKRAIEDHFDASSSLEYLLLKKWKRNLLKEMKKIESLAKFVYVRQATPLGDWHAIMCAKHCISPWEDFAVLFGDDIIDNETPALSQLIQVYNQTKSPVIWVKAIDWKDIENYWVVALHKQSMQVSSLTEKPKFEEAPSNLGIIWKYICTYDIFDSIEAWSAWPDWELRLIDGLSHQLQSRQIYAHAIVWDRYDTWSKLWWIKANIVYALKDPSLRKSLYSYIKSIASQEQS